VGFAKAILAYGTAQRISRAIHHPAQFGATSRPRLLWADLAPMRALQMPDYSEVRNAHDCAAPLGANPFPNAALLVVTDLTLECVDLHLQRHDLDALAVGGARAFVKLRTESGDLGLFVGKGALGLPQPFGLD
jgi:hypothetical protein